MINVSNEEKQYDFIEVGAGSAGSVLAVELSASGVEVLVIESGGPDDAPTITNPSIWFYNVGGPLDYHLSITPLPQLNNRNFNMAVGYVLGAAASMPWCGSGACSARSRPMDTLPAKGKGVGLLLILLLTVFFTAAAANPAVGQVQLPTVNLWDTNFEDGFGAPGWLLEEFPGGYTADELKDCKGKTVPGSSRVTTYSTTSHAVFASRKRLLRGWIAGEVLLPLVDLDVQLANGTQSRVRGFADLTVGAGLQWARPGNLVSRE